MGTSGGDIEPSVDLVGEDPSLPIEGRTWMYGLAMTPGASPYAYSPHVRGHEILCEPVHIIVDRSEVTIVATGPSEWMYRGPLDDVFSLALTFLSFTDRRFPLHFVVLLTIGSENPGEIVLYASRSGLGVAGVLRRVADVLGLPMPEPEASIESEEIAAAETGEQTGPLPDSDPAEPGGGQERVLGPLRCSESEGLTTFETSLSRFEGGGISWALIELFDVFLLPFGVLLLTVGVLVQGLVIARTTSSLQLKFDNSRVEITRLRDTRVLTDWHRPLSELRDVKITILGPGQWAVLLQTQDDAEIFGANARLGREHAEFVRDALLERLRPRGPRGHSDAPAPAKASPERGERPQPPGRPPGRMGPRV